MLLGGTFAARHKHQITQWYAYIIQIPQRVNLQTSDSVTAQAARLPQHLYYVSELNGLMEFTLPYFMQWCLKHAKLAPPTHLPRHTCSPIELNPSDYEYFCVRGVKGVSKLYVVPCTKVLKQRKCYFYLDCWDLTFFSLNVQDHNHLPKPQRVWDMMVLAQDIIPME